VTTKDIVRAFEAMTFEDVFEICLCSLEPTSSFLSHGSMDSVTSLFADTSPFRDSDIATASKEDYFTSGTPLPQTFHPTLDQ